MQKSSLDTILFSYNLEVTNKATPSHLRIRDYIITIIFTSKKLNDPSAALFITKLRFHYKIVPIKRIEQDRTKYAIDKFKTVLARINWDSFYSEITKQELYKIINFNVFKSN